MLNAKTKHEFRLRTNEVLREKRLIVSIIALLLIGLGIAALFAPQYFLGSLMILLGLFLVLSGLIKAGQLLLRSAPPKIGFGAILFIGTQALTDIVIGIVLLNELNFTVFVFESFLGALLVFEGLIQITHGLRAPRKITQILLTLSGATTMYFGIMIALQVFEKLEMWIGLIIGTKLILYSTVLLLATLVRPGHENPTILARKQKTKLKKIPGALYAGYFGGGFHTGIYVGDNQVVHIRPRDGKWVLKTSWDDFRRERDIQRWDYPDVEKVSRKEIVKIALSLAGEKYGSFDLFSNNCEHFAIYCLSGGVTTTSQYAQNTAARKVMVSHPFVGPMIEYYSRIAEWVLFKIGGDMGKRLSLKIRKLNTMLTAWSLSQGKNKK